MTFTFNNYANSELMKSPINDIIGNLLGGYEQGVKASYLQPSLAEQLKKAQLENKWYEPNMESQIGLRGAQAGQAQAHTGLLGEQTRAAHMQNQYLPDQLKAKMEAARLKAMQDQMFNQMLQQRLSGNQGQQPMPTPEYSPGQGQVPFRGQQSPFVQPQIPQPQTNNFDFGQAPQLTNDDIINKKFFNMDTFTPRYKAYFDAISKNMGRKEAAQFKLDSEQAMADFKESSKAQSDLPVLNQALEHAKRMKEIIQNRPGFFGHWIAPGLFAKRSTDPLSGEFQGLLVPQIAAIEKQLSERGNQLALKTSSQKLPGFDETQASAMGKIDSLINTLQGRIAATQDMAGGNIIRRGNKRFKFIDGHWYELKRGDY